MASSNSESSLRLDPRFCRLFEAVCAHCPQGSRAAGRDDATDVGIRPCLPPLADRAIAELAKCRALTHRETEVLTLCCAGLKNRVIAQQLGISPSAVRRHLRNLHRKTRTSDKAELILNLWHSCAMHSHRDQKQPAAARLGRAPLAPRRAR